jgi:type II secretory pathway component GspD/PulD (secretin)
MPIERNRATGRIFAASALAITPAFITSAVLAQTAGTEHGIGGAPAAPAAPQVDTSGVAADLARAQTLSNNGELVRAKALLAGLLSSARLKSAPPAVRDDVLDLMKNVEVRLTSADPNEISLQKADLAIQDGDFLAAERHASAVKNKSGSLASQRARAADLLDSINQRRSDLSPLVANAIAQMQEDYAAGRYAQAKGCIVAIKNTGIVLTEDQTRAVERYQGRILDIESAQGRLFPCDEVGLAVFQPGVVRRERPAGEPAPTTPPPAGENPSETPGEGPAPARAPAEAPVAQPETPAAPAAQPTEQPATPAQPTNQEDLIQRALRIDAQRVLAEADNEFREGRWNSAQERYLRLLSAYRQYLTPEEISGAEARLTEARIKLNQGPVDIVGEITLLRDATRAEFNNAMSEADRALEQGDVGHARDLVASARLTYGKNKQHFNPQEQSDEFVKPLNEMSRKIEAREAEIEQGKTAAKTKRIEEETAARQTELTKEKERTINEAISRARALQQEQKYAEALQVVDQVLFLDPRNPIALLLRDTYKDIVIYQEYWAIQRDKQYNSARQTLESERDMIPPEPIMDYPSDWPARSFGRGDYGAFADTPENRKSLAKLDTKIPVNFRDNSVADILKYITSLTDVSIDPEWDSLRDVGVNEDTTVSYSLTTKLPAHVVLDRVLGKVSTDALSKAGWAVSDGVVRVASQDVLNKDRTLVIYDIQDLLFDIPNYEDVPQIDLQSLLQQSQQGGGGGGQSPFRDDQQRNQGRDPNRPTLEDRINLIRSIITSNVDPEGWVEGGGEVGTIQELNGSLIINNTPKNHREIVGLLSKLRQIRSMQINVETKFLLVNQSWFEQIGFDIDLVLNANNNQFRTIRATQPNAVPSDLFNFGSDSAATGGRRGLQRRVNPFDYNGNGNTTDAGEAGAGVTNPRSWSPIGFLSDSLGLTNSLVEGDFATSVVNASPALGIAGQFLDDIQVDFLVTATQADKRTVQLTAPRLTFTNGQTANIFVVTQQAFISDLQPVVGDSAVGFDPMVAVASEGVTMLMEGVISADRRYVTLNVDAGVGRIDGFDQAAVTAVAGGQLVNSADTQSFIQLPTITVTRVRTSVTVPDEGTVLLGGQRLITELEVETGVPVLSKIPIINRFFTNRVESKEEQTLLILVKPTILIQAEQEEKRFPGLADSLQTGLR